MAINLNFYLMGGKHNSKMASAFAPTNVNLSYDLSSKIKGDEMPFEFSLVKLTSNNKGLIVSNDLSELKDVWQDYLPNNLAWPFFSEKLKSTIDSNLTGREGLTWVKAIVRSADQQKEYFIPKFSKKLDVLNEDKTLFLPGSTRIIKPCFSLRKVGDLTLFYKPSTFWTITPEIYICEKLKNILVKEKITGVQFEKTAVY